MMRTALPTSGQAMGHSAHGLTVYGVIEFRA